MAGATARVKTRPIKGELWRPRRLRLIEASAAGRSGRQPDERRRSANRGPLCQAHNQGSEKKKIDPHVK